VDHRATRTRSSRARAVGRGYRHRGPLFFPCIETTEFTSTDAGTIVHHRFRLEGCGPLTRLRFRIARPFGRRVLSRSGRELGRVLEEDAMKRGRPLG
jgi:hypothetical protein